MPPHSLQGVMRMKDSYSCLIMSEPVIAALKNLKDMGNTLLVVEHDEDTMFAADHIVDIRIPYRA